MSDEPRALDLRCGEGWIAHQLLRWGARRVLAVDDRERPLRRAKLMREHFAIPADELEISGRDSIESVPGGADSACDVVVLYDACELGPDAGLLALARSRCRGICALECEAEAADSVAELALASGFAAVDRLRPPIGAPPAFVLGRRDVLIARVAKR
jgi:hypothetical protein